MPWKLIAFIALLIFFVVFSGLNVQKIQLNLGIVTFSDVPIFVALMVAFILGTVITVPFMMVFSKNKRLLKKSGKKEDVQDLEQKNGEKTKAIADKIRDEH
jgi:uncharacterized integral membrane protein